VSGRLSQTILCLFFIGLLGCALLPAQAQAVGEGSPERKLKTQVRPVYPELARRLAVTGTVKIQVTITSAGAVKQAKVIGGHPLLVDSVLDAVKRWKYESGAAESVQAVEIKFSPQQ
jgi:TonB family protein